MPSAVSYAIINDQNDGMEHITVSDNIIASPETDFAETVFRGDFNGTTKAFIVNKGFYLSGIEIWHDGYIRMISAIYVDAIGDISNPRHKRARLNWGGPIGGPNVLKCGSYEVIVGIGGRFSGSTFTILSIVKKNVKTGGMIVNDINPNLQIGTMMYSSFNLENMINGASIVYNHLQVGQIPSLSRKRIADVFGPDINNVVPDLNYRREHTSLLIGNTAETLYTFEAAPDEYIAGIDVIIHLVPPFPVGRILKIYTCKLRDISNPVYIPHDVGVPINEAGRIENVRLDPYELIIGIGFNINAAHVLKLTFSIVNVSTGDTRFINIGSSTTLEHPIVYLSDHHDVTGFSFRYGAFMNTISGLQFRNHSAIYSNVTEKDRLECCMGNNKYCLGYAPQSKKCDIFMKEYCKKNTKDPRCACLNNNSQPAVCTSTCNITGYVPASQMPYLMGGASKCPPSVIVNCDQTTTLTHAQQSVMEDVNMQCGHFESQKEQPPETSPDVISGANLYIILFILLLLAIVLTSRVVKKLSRGKVAEPSQT